MAKFKVSKTTNHAVAYNTGTGLKGGLTSLTGNQIAPRVKIGAAANAAGSILAQKGAKKFLVTDGASIADESLTVGNRYMILTVGTTDWKSVAGIDNAAVGKVFTCKAVGAGTGTAAAVEICTLANVANGSLAAGQMNILCTKQDTTTFFAKKINNKFVWDFSDNKYLVGSAGSTSTTPATVAIARS